MVSGSASGVGVGGLEPVITYIFLNSNPKISNYARPNVTNEAFAMERQCRGIASRSQFDCSAFISRPDPPRVGGLSDHQQHRMHSYLDRHKA